MSISQFNEPSLGLHLWIWMLILCGLTNPVLGQLFFTEDFGNITTLTPSGVSLTGACGLGDGEDHFAVTVSEDNSEFDLPDPTNAFLSAHDTDHGSCLSTNDLVSALIEDINIVGKTDIILCFDIAEGDDGSNEDWDESDFVRFEVRFDNSGSFATIADIQATGETNTEPGFDCDGDLFADDIKITNSFTTYCFELAESGSLLDIRISINELVAGDEDIAIDNIQLFEGLGSATNPCADCTSEVTIDSLICLGDTIDFGDAMLASAGVYIDSLTNGAMCDSIVTLNLSTEVCCDISIAFIDTVCLNDDTYELHFQMTYVDPISSGFEIVIDGSPIDTMAYADGVSGGTVVVAAEMMGDGTSGIELIVRDTIQVSNSNFAPFISELHYDNVSTDVNEGIEITGPASLSLMGYQVVVYNGGDSMVQTTVDITQSLSDLGDGCGVLLVPIPGLQNGTEAIALVDGVGAVLDFISYEGEILALDGPASGRTSFNIGVSETGSTPLDSSLQRIDGGVWIGPSLASFGTLNSGLSCPTSISFYVCSDTLSFSEPLCKFCMRIETVIDSSICQGQTILFDGDELSMSNTYSDTIPNGDMCDSIIILNLTVNDTSHYEFSEMICQDAIYNFNGDMLSVPGTYRDTMTNTAMCDSFIVLTLTFLEIDTTQVASSICDGDSLEFNSVFIKTGGVYYESMTGTDLCDSIIELTLSILQIDTTQVASSICNGDSLEFNSVFIKTGGVYYESMTGTDLCDSIIELTLSIIPLDTTIHVDQTCANVAYEIGDSTFTEAGTYYVVLDGDDGCDSIVQLMLTVLDTLTETISYQGCEGDGYSIMLGMTIYDEGNPTGVEILSATNGCDSVITVNLEYQALPGDPMIDPLVLCFGNIETTLEPSSVSVGTVFWTETFDEEGAGVVGGCTGSSPSTCATNISPTNGQWSITGDASGLTQTTDYFRVEGGHLEAQDLDTKICFTSEIIDISTYTSVDFSVVISQEGMFESSDSAITTLIVDGVPMLISELNDDWGSEIVEEIRISGSILQIEICVLNNAGTEQIHIDDITLTGSNLTFNFYSDVLGTPIMGAQGLVSYDPEVINPDVYNYWVSASDGLCRSDTVMTSITILENDTTQISSSICDGDSLEFNSVFIKTGGVYYESMTGTDLCDSIIELTLSIIPLDTTIHVDQTCANVAYEIGDSTFTEAGTYYVVLDGNSGCDSIVQLMLTVLDTLTETISYQGCEGDGYSIMLGMTIYDEGNPTGVEILSATNGCDSVITVNLEYQALPGDPMIDPLVLCFGNIETTLEPSSVSVGTVFWTETFDEEGAGVVGGCTGSSPSTCATNISPTNGQWSITGDASGLTQTTDYFRVEGGHLEAQDLDTKICFTSEIIDISTYTSVDFSVVISQEGMFESSDSAITTLIVDGVPMLISELNDDWGSEIVEEIRISGSILQIEICVLNNAGTEQIHIDDITLTGSNLTFDFYSDDVGTPIMGAQGLVSYDPEVINPDVYNYWVSASDGLCRSDTVMTSITILENDTTQISSSICDGDSLEFNSVFIKTGGVYYESMTGTDLCDSIIELTLSIIPLDTTIHVDQTCANVAYEIGDSTFTEAGTYYVVLDGNSGCDSIVQLMLTVLDTLTETISYQGCEGDGYSIMLGMTIYDEGNPTGVEILSATNGCDSVITVNLEYQALPGDPMIDPLVLCFGNIETTLEPSSVGVGTVFWTETFDEEGAGVVGGCTGSSPSTCATNISPSNGQWSITGDASGLTETTDYFRVEGGHLEAQDVDSKICFTSELVDISAYTSVDFSVVISQEGMFESGDSAITTLIVDGVPMLISELNDDWGSEKVEETGISGSILQIEICVLNNAGTEQIRIDDITLTGSNLTFDFYSDDVGTPIMGAQGLVSYDPEVIDPDVYNYWVSASDGLCRSDTVMTSITILENDTTQISSSICDGDSLEFNSVFIKTGGVYYESMTGTDLCDSIIELTLSIIPIDTTVHVDQTCANVAYEIGDSTFTEAGTYYVVLDGDDGCDSIVQLDLMVLDNVESVITATICEGETYEFKGLELTLPGVYRDTIPSSTLCDSFIVLTLKTEICCSIDLAFVDTTCNLDGTYQLSFIMETNGVQGDSAIVQIAGIVIDTIAYPAMDGEVMSVQTGFQGMGDNGVELVVSDYDPHAGIFISEIHYDDSGTDTLEGYEITAPAGTDLSNYKVVLYNGSNNATYGELELSGMVSDAGAGCGSIYFLDVLQNGSPDGLALVTADEREVLEFISYEGVITASNGAALGMTSDDIGVVESGSTVEMMSLQKTDSGWSGPLSMSRDVVNSSLRCEEEKVCSDTLSYQAPICVNEICSIDINVIDMICNEDGTFNMLYNLSTTNPLGNGFHILNGFDTIQSNQEFPTLSSDTLLARISRSEDPIQLSIVDNGSTPAINEVFISEIHYSNSGDDESEGVEITAPIGTNLDGYTLLFYNGNNGKVYRSEVLSGTIVGSMECGALFFELPNNALQNGPDGVTLIDPLGEVLEFISYEGTIVAEDGEAKGLQSVDIGIQESDASDPEFSLQLEDNAWVLQTRTPSEINENLSCKESVPADICATTLTLTSPTCAIYDLALEKSLNENQGAFVNPGDTIEFFLQVNNQGEATVYDIEVSDMIPEGLIFEGSLNHENWSEELIYTSIASLEAGMDTTVSIFLIVDPSYQGGRMMNIAEILSANQFPGFFPIVDVDNAIIADHISQAPIILCGEINIPQPVLDPISLCNDPNNIATITPLGGESSVALIEDFESEGLGVRYEFSEGAFNDLKGDYFTRTNGSDLSISAFKLVNQSGEYWFGAQDINGEGGNEVQTILIQPASIRGLGGLELSVLMAEEDDGSQEDYDNQPSDKDFVHIDYAIDKGSFTNAIHIHASAASGANSEPAIDGDYDGVGEGVAITDTFKIFIFSIPEVGEEITIRITIKLDDGDEDIAIDDIQVKGEPVTYNFYNANGSQLANDVRSYDLDIEPNAILTDIFVQSQWEGCAGELFPFAIQQHPENNSLACYSSVNLNVDASCSIIGVSSELFYTSDIHPSFITWELKGPSNETIDPNDVSAYFNQEVIFEVTDICSGAVCWGKVNLESKNIPIPLTKVDTICCMPDLELQKYVDADAIEAYLIEGCNAEYSNLRWESHSIGSICDTSIHVIKYLADFVRDQYKVSSIVGLDSLIVTPILDLQLYDPGSHNLGDASALVDTITIQACQPFDLSPKSIADYWSGIHDSGDLNNNGKSEGIPFAYPYLIKDSTLRTTRQLNLTTIEVPIDTTLLINGLWVQTQVIQKDTIIDTIYTDAYTPNYVAMRSGKNCNWDISYSDQYYSACFDKSKVLRTWKMLDWCSAAIRESFQWIRYEDTEAPEFNVIQVDIVFVTDDSLLIDGVPTNIDSFDVFVDIDLESLLRILSIDNGAICEARMKVPEFPDLVDNCTLKDDLKITYKIDGWPVVPIGGFLSGFPNGTSLLETTATDYCGNSTSHEMTIISLDRSAPEVHCRDKVNVTLIDDYGRFDGGQARVYLEDLDFGTTDACSDIILILGRRTDNNFFCGPNDSLLTAIGTEYIEFCCEDLGKDIPIQLTFFDAFGNTGRCWTEVHVDSKIITQLYVSDAAVGCYDSTDPDSTGYASVSGVCETEVLRYQDNYNYFNDQCGVGRIERKWYVIDDTSNYVIQNIYMNPDSNYLFDPYSIQWPKHYTKAYIHDVVIREWQGDTISTYWPDTLGIFNCREHEAITCLEMISDIPDWTAPKCGLIDMSYEDKEFNAGVASCGAFIRSYTIIDWCVYRPNMSNYEFSPKFQFVKDKCIDDEYYQYDTVVENGIYTYNQLVYIEDHSPPAIISCDELQVYADYNCEGILPMSIIVRDEGLCGGSQIHWYLELYNDQEELLVNTRGLANSMDTIYYTSSELAIGEYRANWRIVDECGNSVTCTQYYSIADAKGPELLCYEDLATIVMNEEAVARIWAIDYVLKATSDCNDDEHIIYTFDTTDLDAISITLGCEEIRLLADGIWSGEIYAIDENRNYNSCQVNLRVEDHSGICDDDSVLGSEEGKVSTRKVDNRTDRVYLNQNVPNPFSETTQIEFYLPLDSKATISVYNYLGQKVQYMVDDYQAGRNTVSLSHGNLGQAGVYIYEIQVDGVHLRKRLLLVD